MTSSAASRQVQRLHLRAPDDTLAGRGVRLIEDALRTASLPDANVNQAYTSPPLAASGAPVNSWSLASGTLPAGLTLAPNGVISGTPTQGGLFGFTVQANATGAACTRPPPADGVARACRRRRSA